MATKIEIEEVGERELYAGKALYPQSRCFIELDCVHRTLGAVMSTLNGTPMRVFNGLALRFPIPCLCGEAVNAYLPELTGIAERICAGFEIIWDGSNHRGRFDDDASDAIVDLAAVIELREWTQHELCGPPWDAADWFAASVDELPVSHWATNKQLQAMADEYTAAAATDGYEVEGVFEYLCDLRDRLCDEVDAEAEVEEK